MAQSSFAFDPENIHSIREKILYLVKWGFPYSDVRNIPLDEVNEHIENINEYYKRKNNPQNYDSGGSADPKPIGQVNPTVFK